MKDGLERVKNGLQEQFENKTHFHYPGMDVEMKIGDPVSEN